MNSGIFELKVFHEKELDQILRRLNLFGKLRDGELKCAVCNKTVDRGNFGGLYKKGGKLFIVCENVKCLAEAGNYGRD